MQGKEQEVQNLAEQIAKAPELRGTNLPSIFAPQSFGASVLCPAEFWSNVTFSLQTHGDMVSGDKKKHQNYVKIIYFYFVKVIFLNNCHFRDLYNQYDHFLRKTKF